MKQEFVEEKKVKRTSSAFFSFSAMTSFINPTAATRKG